ncbi:MAG: response regulator [Spirochaetales bacterium]|nr:response regulator [Spirochaetales bacterium]
MVSELCKGTLFRIYLPCSPKIKQSEKVEIGSVPGTGTILLVDDEEIIRTTVTEMLTELGYDVLLAKNGEEAVTIFQEEYSKIDLIIIDMIMPEMNGSETFYRMKAIDPNCRVVIASGYTGEENIDKLMADGLSGFINKPFPIDTLSQFLSDVMGN